MIFNSRESEKTKVEPFVYNGASKVIAEGGAGMSFKKYPLICTQCKKGSVLQSNGICTYVMCRFQNKSVF